MYCVNAVSKKQHLIKNYNLYKCPARVDGIRTPSDTGSEIWKSIADAIQKRQKILHWHEFTSGMLHRNIITLGAETERSKQVTHDHFTELETVRLDEKPKERKCG